MLTYAREGIIAYGERSNTDVEDGIFSFLDEGNELLIRIVAFVGLKHYV